MTKEFLKQYLDLIDEEKEIDSEICRLERKGYKSPCISIMPNGGGFWDVEYRKRDMEEYLETIRDRIRVKRIAIEEWIQSIPDSKVRRIFRLRYIEGKPWRAVANKVHYSIRQAISKHDQYLKKS